MKTLTDDERKQLSTAELAIFMAGVDGGETTSDAIDALVTLEKELNVFDEQYDGSYPKWN